MVKILSLIISLYFSTNYIFSLQCFCFTIPYLHSYSIIFKSSSSFFFFPSSSSFSFPLFPHFALSLFFFFLCFPNLHFFLNVICHFLRAPLPCSRTFCCPVGDSSVEIKIYREPTHTDQYLHVRSHRPLEHKLSVVRTLLHRNEIVTDHEGRSKEVKHAKKPLRNYGYKDWAFFRVSNKRGNHPPWR